MCIRHALCQLLDIHNVAETSLHLERWSYCSPHGQMKTYRLRKGKHNTLVTQQQPNNPGLKSKSSREPPHYPNHPMKCSAVPSATHRPNSQSCRADLQ